MNRYWSFLKLLIQFWLMFAGNSASFTQWGELNNTLHQLVQLERTCELHTIFEVFNLKSLAVTTQLFQSIRFCFYEVTVVTPVCFSHIEVIRCPEAWSVSCAANVIFSLPDCNKSLHFLFLSLHWSERPSFSSNVYCRTRWATIRTCSRINLFPTGCFPPLMKFLRIIYLSINISGSSWLVKSI